MLFITMHVRVIAFGVLKEWLGPDAATVELPDGATVGSLLEQLRARLPERAPKDAFSGIAVGVNAEYAQAAQILHDGDEVGLLPPVSGGAAPVRARECFWRRAVESRNVIVALTREAIDADRIVAAAKSGEDGAVVVFDGIVRNHSRGRRTLHLDYEAYEEMAVGQMRELGQEGAGAIRRAPGDDGSPAGAAGDWRDQRADRGGVGASQRGV